MPRNEADSEARLQPTDTRCSHFVRSATALLGCDFSLGRTQQFKNTNTECVASSLTADAQIHAQLVM